MADNRDDRQPASGAGPIEGIRVLDLTRLAPGPYCTMLLADLGADVVVVGGGRSGLPIAEFSRGKRFISLDMKDVAGQVAFRHLAKGADVVVEGFRPGVAARLGAGYDELSVLNPRLIYCSLTGYGQEGPLAQEAGHDINYLSLAGVLGAIGTADGPPVAPLNLLADFAGGSLLAAFGIAAALFERERSGQGQYIDSAMIDGCMSMMSMHFADWGSSVLPRRGKGLLTGNAPYYRTYECADGKYVSVGALEDAFFHALWTTLGFFEPFPDHMNEALWPEMERLFGETFLTRTRDEWAEVFHGVDACVAPVLAPDEVAEHPHTEARHGGFAKGGVPAAPLLSRTPARAYDEASADDTEAVLAEAGMNEADVKAAVKSVAGAVKGLSWPPEINNVPGPLGSTLRDKVAEPSE